MISTLSDMTINVKQEREHKKTLNAELNLEG